MIFSGDQQEVQASTVIHPPYQGFDGVVHGGILAGIVDDAMWHAIHQQKDVFPMTAELKVRYHVPAKIGDALTVKAHVTLFRPRLMAAEATIYNSEGAVVVTAEGRFMPNRHA